MAEESYDLKSKNKVRLGFFSIENAINRYCCGFILLKCWNKVLLEFYFIGNAKIRCGCGFSFLKMLKKDVAVILIFLKC